MNYFYSILCFFLLVSGLSSCQSIDKSQETADRFYENLKQKNYEATAEEMDEALKAVTTKDAWISMLRLKEPHGALVSYERTGFKTNTNEGVNTTELKYTVKYEKKTLYEDLHFIERDGEYLIISYQFDVMPLEEADKLEAEAEEFVNSIFERLKTSDYESILADLDEAILTDYPKEVWLDVFKQKETLGAMESYKKQSGSRIGNPEEELLFDFNYTSKFPDTELFEEIRVSKKDGVFKLKSYSYNSKVETMEDIDPAAEALASSFYEKLKKEDYQAALSDIQETVLKESTEEAWLGVFNQKKDFGAMTEFSKNRALNVDDGNVEFSYTTIHEKSKFSETLLLLKTDTGFKVGGYNYQEIESE